jgi:hypothetical protein
MKSIRLLILSLFALLAVLPIANAQTTSATVTGLLTDPTGGAIVGAKVQLTNDLSKQVNEFTTDSGGRFEFQVTAGDYTFHVAQAGFKAYEQKVNVVQTERFDMHEIKLTVGDVATSVEVTAAIAHVQTDSSDRTIAVNQTQIEDTPSAGRNFLNILRSLPGSAMTTTSDGRGGTGAAGGGTGGNSAVNGAAGQLLVTLDGIVSQDSGAPGTGGYQAPSMDAVGEVQLMISNYTSEYGARNGGQMNVTIKNGTNQFHGTVYYYKRHEMFDANEWFNNKNTVTINGIPGQATPKPIYRWSNPGGTIGGPLYIPGKFNKNRDKLFFFYSEDDMTHTGTNGPNHYTMPTALERAGNFSQTFTSAGVLIPIYQPGSASTIPFAGNIVPASQISPQGYALLNLFPIPCGGQACTTANGLDPSGARGYNFTNYFTNSNPFQDRILRVDAPLGKKTSIYVRGLQDYYATQGVGSLLQASGAGWGQFLSTYGVPNVGIVGNAIHTFRPNLINELTFGINRSHQIVHATNLAACPQGAVANLTTGQALPYTCSQLTDPNLVGPTGQAVTLPNLFPGANTLNTLPNVSFGTGGGFSQQSAGPGVTGTAPSFGFDTRWPFSGTDQITTITDNTTWIKGKHTVKWGYYLEHDSRNVSVYNLYNTDGSVYFGSDLANGNDSGYPFSNALLGSMFAYGADNKRQVNHSRYTTHEFFLQDTWKLTRRLTLDYGIRVQSIGQEEDLGASLGFFNTASYSPTAVGQLLFPACSIANGSAACPAADKYAVNPKTGARYPYAQVNTFDPASYPANGYPWSGAKFYTSSFWNRGKPDLGPRIGFAYDVLGNGKMAIRGGFGIFYGRASSVDQIAAGSGGTGPVEVAPNFLAPAYVYPTFNSLAGQTAAYAPQTVYGGTQNILNPQTLQWSFGVQRDLGKGTILDVSYLGWITHHGYNETGYDLNTVPLLTDWKPTAGPGTNSCGQVTALLDPTAAAVNPATCSGGTFLNSNLIRGIYSYEGWQSIGVSVNNGEVKYDALQVQFNKRFGRRLQYGVNYTWAKELQYTYSQDIPMPLTYSANTSNGVRPHAANANFGYKLQNGTDLLPSSAKNYVTKLILDGWNINGVVSLYMGSEFDVTCGLTSNPSGYFTGTPVDGPGERCNIKGSIWLPAGSTPSSVGSTGDPRLWYPLNAGPGVNEAVAGFQTPAPNTLGIGNNPLVNGYGPGFENLDLSAFKEITLGKETRVLQFRAETFNTFNHFNPSNPSTSLTYNYLTGAQTNGNFGLITGAQNTARHMALSLRIRF